MTLDDNLKDDPQVISDNIGEDITPDNTVKQFPVDIINEEEVNKVEVGVDQYGQPLGTTR